jgi:integrase
LKPYHVQQWVDEYDFSVTSRRNYLRTIKRCLTWAVRQGYLDRNPIAAIEIPAAENREIVVTPEEYAAMMSVVHDEHLRDLIIVTWETGCRPQESLRVEGRHIDRMNKRWVFPKTESKNKKLSRVVYLSDSAFAITLRRIAICPSGALFRNSLGRPWTTEAVNCGFGRIRARLGLRTLKEGGFELNEDEVHAFAKTLKVQKTEHGGMRAISPNVNFSAKPAASSCSDGHLDWSQTTRCMPCAILGQLTLSSGVLTRSLWPS